MPTQTSRRRAAATAEPAQPAPSAEAARDVKRQRGYRATDAVYEPAQDAAAAAGVALASIIDAALLAVAEPKSSVGSALIVKARALSSRGE